MYSWIALRIFLESGIHLLCHFRLKRIHLLRRYPLEFGLDAVNRTVPCVQHIFHSFGMNNSSVSEQWVSPEKCLTRAEQVLLLSTASFMGNLGRRGNNSWMDFKGQRVLAHFVHMLTTNVGYKATAAAADPVVITECVEPFFFNRHGRPATTCVE